MGVRYVIYSFCCASYACHDEILILLLSFMCVFFFLYVVCLCQENTRSQECDESEGMLFIPCVFYHAIVILLVGVEAEGAAPQGPAGGAKVP